MTMNGPSSVVKKVRHLLFQHPVAEAPLDIQMLIFLLRFSRDDLKENKYWIFKERHWITQEYTGIILSRWSATYSVSRFKGFIPFH